MLWIKALHIIFVVTWFAGLFYLPRLFVYHAETSDPAIRAQLKIMERRLLIITHVGGTLAVVFGLATLGWWITNVPGYLAINHWMQVKLLLVAALVAYHLYLVRLKNQFAAGNQLHSSRWLRLFNEVPALLLIAIVILVVVKPL